MTGRRVRRALLADLPVKVICLTAAVILFLFHRVNTMTERFFSVPLAVVTPSGLAIASAFPKTVRITLRGAEEAIYPILEEDIEASANLEARRNPGVYRAQVRITRKGTAASVEPLEIKVEPQEIMFSLEPLAERRVSVVPDLRGAPAYGYELSQSSVTPLTVMIRGARSRVQAVTTLPTEEIDLTGRTDSFAARAKVVLPSSLLRVAGDASVDFRGTIREALSSRLFDGVPMEGTNLGAHLSLRAPLPLGTVQLQGPQLGLDSVRPDQVKLLLDLSGLRRAGEYTLRPRPEAPAGFLVLDWTPRNVTVELDPSSREEVRR